MAFFENLGAEITVFDAPGASGGTYSAGINHEGNITGYFVDANGLSHGFVRDHDGTIHTFDVAGAGTAANQGTSPLSINACGAVTGAFVDDAILFRRRVKEGTFVRGPGVEGDLPLRVA